MSVFSPCLYDGLFNEVGWVASPLEVCSQDDCVVVVVFNPGANLSYAEELSVGETFFGMTRMG